MITILAPTLDASTVEGQFQWFLMGIYLGAFPSLIALAIHLFKKTPGPGSYDI